MIKITTKSIFDEKELGKGGRAVFDSSYPYLKENDIIKRINGKSVTEIKNIQKNYSKKCLNFIHRICG